MSCFHAHRLSKTMTHTGRRFQDQKVGVFPSLLAKSNWNRIAIQLPWAMPLMQSHEKCVDVVWNICHDSWNDAIICKRHDCNDVQCLLLARLVHTTWDDEWLVVQSLNYITMRSLHVWHITFVHYIMPNKDGSFILDVIWAVFFLIVPCPIHWVNAYANASACLRGLHRVPTPEVFNTRCLRGCLRGVLCWIVMFLVSEDCIFELCSIFELLTFIRQFRHPDTAIRQ